MRTKRYSQKKNYTTGIYVSLWTTKFKIILRRISSVVYDLTTFP